MTRRVRSTPLRSLNRVRSTALVHYNCPYILLDVFN
ncbi:MAG: hypothetical protein ACI9HK_006093, partial [Pirellulaceae bacterium]